MFRSGFLKTNKRTLTILFSIGRKKMFVVDFLKRDR
jgi:hypothetical protein